MRAALALATVVASLIAPGLEAAADGPEPTPLARAFGTIPGMWDAKLSPSGTGISFLQMHPSGLPVLTTFDMTSQTAVLALAAPEEEADFSWCDWADDDRLLCGLKSPVRDGFIYYEATRLVAVDADGANPRVLLQDDLSHQFAQIQDRVVDWMVDDPDRVLVQMPDILRQPAVIANYAGGVGAGFGVVAVDIRSGKTERIERKRGNAFNWLTDGRGQPRLFEKITRTRREWWYRTADDDDWRPLFESRLEDMVDYTPVGFADEPDAHIGVAETSAAQRRDR